MMNHRFFTYFPLWLVLVAGLLLHACTDGLEEPGDKVPGTEEQGTFRLAYRVGGTDIAVQTRADGETTTPAMTQEDGWNDGWNENVVDSLAIFVIDKDGNIKGRISGLTKDKDDLSEQKEFTKEDLGLNQGETLVAGDRIYMIANYTEATSDESNGSAKEEETDTESGNTKTFHTSTTLADLQTIVNSAELVPNKQQEDFLMDGFVTLTAEHLSGTTATVELRRAAAKIRIYFENDYLLTADDLQKYIVKAKLVYYAPTSLMLKEAESDFDTETYPDRVEPERMGAIDDQYLTYTDEDKNRTYIVFYSYSNNWYDKSKFHYTEGTNGKAGTWKIDDFTKEAPVLRTRQTFVTIYAPYWPKGAPETIHTDNHYYYRVPMNYSLPSNNDQVSFTDDEIADIKHLYCLQRNHIYTIKASIDRAGSKTEDGALILPVTIENLKDGGEYHYEY